MACEPLTVDSAVITVDSALLTVDMTEICEDEPAPAPGPVGPTFNVWDVQVGLLQPQRKRKRLKRMFLLLG
jgi:hypothetical protein